MLCQDLLPFDMVVDGICCGSPETISRRPLRHTSMAWAMVDCEASSKICALEERVKARRTPSATGVVVTGIGPHGWLHAAFNISAHNTRQRWPTDTPPPASSSLVARNSLQGPTET